MKRPTKLTDIIESTLSLCPHCLQTLPATVHVREERVYLYRRCPQHGEFDVCLWPDAASYRWFGDFVFPEQPRAAQTGNVAGCPRDCGLCSQHRRHTTIAEIEVTWRCNLRCPVCFMASPEATPDDPSLNTIAGEFDAIRRYDGINTPVQITGGEPTIRDDLPAIVALGRRAGFRGIELNTNGLVIARNRNHLRALKAVKSTKENLREAITGETHEFKEMYPEMIAAAKEEGAGDAERTFTYANAVEEYHARLYHEMLAGLETKTGSFPYFVCPVCGMTVENEAPEKCPVCGVKGSLFKKIE